MGLKKWFNNEVRDPLTGGSYSRNKARLSKAQRKSREWDNSMSMDPLTGEISGPIFGAPPAGVAKRWQQQHERAVWGYRQRLSRDAIRFAQGAEGLLSRYRAGGGAAIQSGIHSQLANLSMQRADMTQPMDLLGNWREDQARRAAKRGQTEATVGTVLQGVGTVLSLIPGGQAFGAAFIGIGQGVSAYGKQQQAAGRGQAAAAQQAGPARFGGMGGAADQSGGAIAGEGQADGPVLPGGAAGAPPADGGVMGPGGAPLTTGGGPGAPGGQPGGLAPGGAPGGAGPGAGDVPDSPGGGQGGPGGAAGAAGGGGAMAMPPVVGVDGRHDPVAYAQHAAATAYEPISTQLALSENMVELIDQDDSWESMDDIIHAELNARAFRAFGNFDPRYFEPRQNRPAAGVGIQAEEMPIYRMRDY